jgi:ribosomal protein S18 acetylase RimI-like enzyme
MVVIRNASINDIPIILELLYELGRPRPQEDREIDEFSNIVKKYLLSEPTKKIIIAEYDNKIVGMVSMMLLSRLNRKSLELYIPELIVQKDHQNKGIGKKLMESCIDFAKQNKCHRIRLESGNQRIGSHLFYKKLGFEQSSLSFTKNLE